MDRKKNRWLIVLLLVAIAWEMLTIASIKTQNQNLERQIYDIYNDLDSDISGISSTIYGIKEEISEELEKQASILSSNTIDITLKEGLLNLDLSFIPKEYKNEEHVEVVFSSSKETKTSPAINQDGVFLAKAEIKPSDSIKATVRFISESSVRQETISGINVEEMLAFEYNTEFLVEQQGISTETQVGEISDIILVSLFPYYENDRVDTPYKDLESAKVIVTNSDTGKIVGEVNLEKSSKNKYKTDVFIKEGSSVFTADLSEFRSVEGSFLLDCKIITKGGLLYKFDIGIMDYYKSANTGRLNNSFYSTSSGMVYPDF